MANISHFTQTVNGVSTTYDIHDAGAVPRSGGAVMTGWLGKTTDTSNFLICGATSDTKGATMWLYGNDNPNYTGGLRIKLTDSNAGEHWFTLYPNGYAGWNGKTLAMAEDFVPRSGGAVITGTIIGRVDTSAYLNLCGGLNWSNGATIGINGKDSSEAGSIILHPSTGAIQNTMWLLADGTWKWSGTAVQITSDQRLKQQISEIDDKLLDAWEDVNLVQFKYNDAVDQKGKDKARLHTGYVVQQIDSACKSHNVDISEYGLYCHEEYPQETEEVEVEQKDGTKTKERKVIREASEHYSLRYTEVYAVECMYLRRCIARLTARIEELEKRE